jgi:hypothetical protein
MGCEWGPETGKENNKARLYGNSVEFWALTDVRTADPDIVETGRTIR